jgi:hypothetical protein
MIATCSLLQCGVGGDERVFGMQDYEGALPAGAPAVAITRCSQRPSASWRRSS